MDDVIDFLRRFAEAEERGDLAIYLEPSDQAFFALVREVDGFYHGQYFASGLSRRQGQPASTFASEENRAAAEAVTR